MRNAIHALKYDRLRPAARRLGEMLAAVIGRLRAEAPGELLVVPVPLHRSREAMRGFNQARLLAEYAVRELRRMDPGWRLTLAPQTVVRIRATNTQASLTPRQRRINVRGAFQVADPKAVAGKQILVIDDIFTTGATARSMAQALMRSGVAGVWIATLARAELRFSYRGNLNAANSNRELPESTIGGGSAEDPRQDLAADEMDPQLMHSLRRQPSLRGQPSF